MNSVTRRCAHPVVLLAAGLALANVGTAAAQQLSAVTMPLKDDKTDHWKFYGDTLLGVDVDRGILKLSARVNAYSVSQGKPLWRQELDMGYKMNEVQGEVWLQDRNRLIVGTGPLSAVGLDGKSWTLSCDQAGPVDLGEAVQLEPDRILIFGNDSCKDGFKDDPVVMLLNGATGIPVWKHPSKGQWVDAPMGFWQRVSYFQGKTGKKKVLQFRVWPLAQSPNGYVSGLSDLNRWATAKADRILIIGKYMEVLNAADGSVVYRSPKTVDDLEGLFGPFVFLRDGDKLTAVKAGSGERGWTMDLDKSGTTLYDADYFVAQGDTSPLGPDDLLVSEHRFVNRVDLLTGQKKWTVKREGSGWYPALNFLYVTDDAAFTAYDWESGAQRWQIKAGKFLHVLGGQSGPVVVLVERGKKEDDKWVGPFKFVGVDQATGRVVWSRPDLGGKKITSFEFTADGQLAMNSETGGLLVINIADGSTAGGDGSGCYPAYAPAVKSLQCRSATGDVTWERKGEISENYEVQWLSKAVLWAARNGDVEVISRADGTSLWKSKSTGNPRLWFNTGRTEMAVTGNGNITVVHLTPAVQGASK